MDNIQEQERPIDFLVQDIEGLIRVMITEGWDLKSILDSVNTARNNIIKEVGGI